MDGELEYDRWEIKGIFKSRTCPRRLITPESWRWIGLFTLYQAGHLAESGGTSDQPARYIQAMRLINGVVNSG